MLCYRTSLVTPSLPASLHILDSTGQVYICELCDKIFAQKQYLAQHKHRIHGLNLLKSPSVEPPELKEQISEPEITAEETGCSKISPRMPELSPRKTVLELNPQQSVSQVVLETVENKIVESVASPIASTTQSSDNLISVELSLTPTLSNPTIVSESELETDENIPSGSIASEAGSICSKESTDTQKLVATKKFPCDECERAFNHPSNLYRHKTSKHGYVSLNTKKKKKKKKSVPAVEETFPPASKHFVVESEKLENVSPRQEKVLVDEPLIFECEICFRVFRSWSKFQEHSKNLHQFTPNPPQKLLSIETETTNQAKILPSSSSSGDKKIETPEKNIECKICHSKFKNNLGLIIHSRNHHNKLSCSECVEFFDTPDELEDHILVHELQTNLNNQSGPTSTVIADIVPSTVGKESAVVEQDKSKFQCYYCHSTYTERRQLFKHHQKIHSMASCRKCLNAFDTVTELEVHENEVHSKDTNIIAIESDKQTTCTDKNLKCKSCNVYFNLRSSLFTHVKIIHNNVCCPLCLDIFTIKEFAEHKLKCLDPTLICKFCSYYCESRVIYSRHISSHSSHTRDKLHSNESQTEHSLPTLSSASHSTAQTQQTQQQKSSNNLNLNTMRKKKIPFCFYCKKIFDSKKDLWIHVKREHFKNPHYKCNICDEVFYFSRGFSNHKLRVHHKTMSENSHVKQVLTTSSSYKASDTVKSSLAKSTNNVSVQDKTCPVCNKTFASSWQNVARHVIVVHPSVTSYKCDYCVRIFVDYDLKENHQKMHLVSGQVRSLDGVPMRQSSKSVNTCRYCGQVLHMKYNSFLAHEKQHRRLGDKPKSGNSSNTSANAESVEKNAVTSKKDTVNVSPMKTEHSLSFSSPRNESPRSEITNHSVSPNSRASTPTKNKNIICKFCKLQVDTQIHFVEHLKSIHPTELYFSCDKCNKVFYDTGNLNKHKRMHSTTYTMCQYCSRSFARLSYLTNHEKECDMKPKDAESTKQIQKSNSVTPMKHAQTPSKPAISKIATKSPSSQPIKVSTPQPLKTPSTSQPSLPNVTQAQSVTPSHSTQALRSIRLPSDLQISTIPKSSQPQKFIPVPFGGSGIHIEALFKTPTPPPPSQPMPAKPHGLQITPVIKPPPKPPKSTTPKSSSSTLKCRFCSAKLQDAASLIAHLQQHAKDKEKTPKQNGQ